MLPKCNWLRVEMRVFAVVIGPANAAMMAASAVAT